MGITEISEPKIVIYCGIYQNIKVKTYENNSPKYRKDKKQLKNNILKFLNYEGVFDKIKIDCNKLNTHKIKPKQP